MIARSLCNTKAIKTNKMMSGAQPPPTPHIKNHSRRKSFSTQHIVRLEFTAIGLHVIEVRDSLSKNIWFEKALGQEALNYNQ